MLERHVQADVEHENVEGTLWPANGSVAELVPRDRRKNCPSTSSGGKPAAMPPEGRGTCAGFMPSFEGEMSASS